MIRFVCSFVCTILLGLCSDGSRKTLPICNSYAQISQGLGHKSGLKIIQLGLPLREGPLREAGCLESLPLREDVEPVGQFLGLTDIDIVRCHEYAPRFMMRLDAS